MKYERVPEWLTWKLIHAALGADSLIVSDSHEAGTAATAHISIFLASSGTASVPIEYIGKTFFPLLWMTRLTRHRRVIHFGALLEIRVCCLLLLLALHVTSQFKVNAIKLLVCISLKFKYLYNNHNINLLISWNQTQLRPATLSSQKSSYNNSHRVRGRERSLAVCASQPRGWETHASGIMMKRSASTSYRHIKCACKPKDSVFSEARKLDTSEVVSGQWIFNKLPWWVTVKYIK